MYAPHVDKEAFILFILFYFLWHTGDVYASVYSIHIPTISLSSVGHTKVGQNGPWKNHMFMRFRGGLVH
jgi:hypothetical protein